MQRLGQELAGQCVLLVEDQFYIVDEFAKALRALGAEIAGPVARADQAMEIIQRLQALHGAILDIDLQGELVYPVANALVDRNVPFVFVTGYARPSIPARYDDIPSFEKPIEVHRAIHALFPHAGVLDSL